MPRPHRRRPLASAAGALVLIDGLIAGRSPGAVEAAADRLRIVVLAHMVSAAFPDADPRVVEGERRALAKRATRDRDERVDPVRAGRDATSFRRTGSSSRSPGSDDAPVGDRNARRRCAPVRRRRRTAQGAGRPDRGAGSCSTRDAGWTCTIAGSLDACPDYADRVATLAAEAGIGDRDHADGRAHRGRARPRLSAHRPRGGAIARGELRHGHRGCAAARHPGRRQPRGRDPADRRSPAQRSSCHRVSRAL